LEGREKISLLRRVLSHLSAIPCVYSYIRLLKSLLKKRKKPNINSKTKDFLREREGLIYSSKCKYVYSALQTRALTRRDSWFSLISVGTTTLSYANKLRGFTSWTLALTSVMRLPTE